MSQIVLFIEMMMEMNFTIFNLLYPMALANKRILNLNESKKRKKNNEFDLVEMNKYKRTIFGQLFSTNDLIDSYIRNSLSDLGLSYLAQIVNPFNFRDNPIQSIHLFGRASKLYTAGLRFTFTTSTATTAKGYGFVAISPYAMVQNTDDSIFCSQSTTTISVIPTEAQTTTSVGTTLVTVQSTDSPFTDSNFTANAREYRVVAAGIRCRNISPRDYLGGSIVGIHTPNNATAEGIGYLSACDYEHTRPYSFDQDWVSVFWKPTHPDNHVFWPTYTDSFTSPTGWSWCPLGMIIQAPDDTFATKIDCEVVCIFEVTGYSERGCEPRARDAEEAVKALSFLQNTCSYKGGMENINYSIPYDIL